MNKKIGWRGFIGLMLVLTFVLGTAAPAFAAKSSIERPTKSYDVAVVFDNSGSMYCEPNKESWCRTKYAMEIFASMLNFGNGDRMTIFPMWYVSTNAEPEKTSRGVQSVSVQKLDDLNKITQMYTPGTDGTATPFKPVREAYQFLQQSGKDVKWLIVLTDGTFNMEERSGPEKEPLFTRDELKRQFLTMASSNIRVQYLAIGADIKPEAELSQATSPESYFYADLAKDTNGITDKMIEICNRIFERQALPNKFISQSEQKITLDVSMSNLIVFVAGKDAGVKALTDGSGRPVPSANDSGVRQWSSKKYGHGKNYPSMAEDRSLYGQVVTFEKCPKGTYTLNYSGKIQIFYEPDIRIDIKIATDPEGKDVIEPNREGETKTLEEGQYYVFYDLVDNVTSEPVTNNPLVDVKKLEASMTIKAADGTERKIPLDKSGSAVDFVEGETIVFNVEGEYLNGYRIRTADNLNEYTFNIKKSTTLKLKLDQTQTWYQTGKELKWEPIVATATLGRKSVDPKLFKKCVLEIESDPQISCQIVPDPENSRYLIYPGRDEKGNAVTPAVGRYKITAVMRCTDDNEKVQPSKPVNAAFKVRGYPYWYIIAAWILLLLLIIGLILFILSRKAMPKDIKLVPDSTEFRVRGRKQEGLAATVKYNKKGRSLMIKTPPYDPEPLAGGSVTFRLEPIDRLWTKSKNRRVTVTGISASGSVAEIDLLGVTYEKHPRTRQWMDSAYLDDDNDGGAARPISQNIRNADLSLVMRNGRVKLSELSCEMKHK